MDSHFEHRASGHRGRQVKWAGHRQIELESPTLRVRASASRGAEIQEILHKPSDTELLWRGHPGIARNEVHAPSVNRPDGNFLDHFSGGWQVVLPAANYPVEHRGASIGQHGEAALLPWAVEVTHDQFESVEVRFTVELRTAPLVIQRTLRLEGAEVGVHESITNLGRSVHHVQWGQHITLAGTALPAGTEIRLHGAPPVSVPEAQSPTYRFQSGRYTWPEAKRRDGSSTNTSLIGGDDHTEGHLIVGPLSRAAVEVRTPGDTPNLTMTWDESSHPYCWIWEVLGGHDQWPLWGRHRLIAIEPFNVPLEPLHESITGSRATAIEPGATVSSRFVLTVNDNNDKEVIHGQ